MKSLVVYYSKTGTTRKVAEKIAKELNAEIEELTKIKEDKKGLLSRFRSGPNETVPVPVATQKNPKDYDLILIGTPIWNLGPTPAIRNYLANNDLSGKRVALFCTYGNGGEKQTFGKLKKLIPNATIVGEFGLSIWARRNSKEAEKKIVAWSSGLKFA